MKVTELERRGVLCSENCLKQGADGSTHNHSRRGSRMARFFPAAPGLGLEICLDTALQVFTTGQSELSCRLKTMSRPGSE